MSPSPRPALEPSRASVRMQLAALWTSTTLCYIYCDYFELYQPGKLQSMLGGQFAPIGPTTQSVLLGASAFLAVPCVMIALTMVLPASVSRVLNLLFGVVYTIVMLLLLPEVWQFYQLFAAIEVVLTASVVWLAWRWPRGGVGVRAGA